MLKDVFLQEGCIFGLKGSDKEAVFEEMCGKLLKYGRITDKAQFMDALRKREQIGPTGMGDGVAIPHGKSSCVVAPTLIFGRHDQGIAYESLDNGPVHSIFMIAVGETVDDMHLRILSSLARKLVHPEFVEQLKRAADGAEIAALL